MAKYIESTDLSKIEALQSIISYHLDGVKCVSVVPTLSHLTESKYAINYDLVISSVGTLYKTEREQQMKDFVTNNTPDVYFVNYDNLIVAGYEKDIE